MSPSSDESQSFADFLQKNFKLILWITISLTICMMVFAGLFQINEYLDHPQFAHFDNYDNCLNEIKDKGRVKWFRAFFITDFIWAPFLLLLMYLLIKKLLVKIENHDDLAAVKLKGSRFYVLVAIVAYILDCIENCHYMLMIEGIGERLEIIVLLKTIAYGIAFTLLIYHVLLWFVYPFKKTILKFLKSSFISLTFILIILFLITGVAQGPTLVVDLLEKEINLFGMFFLLTFFALILSHYPLYLGIAQSDNASYNLEMDTKRPILGLGIVYSKPNGNRSDFRLRYLRRGLGILVYITFLYLLLTVTVMYFELSSKIPLICFLLYIILLVYYYKKEEQRFHNNNIIYDTKSSVSSVNKATSSIIKSAKLCIRLWLLGILMAIVTSICSWKLGWSWWTIGSAIVTLLINLMAFVYFRISRSDLKYVYWSKALESYNPDFFMAPHKKRKKTIINTGVKLQNMNSGFLRKLAFKTGQKIAYLSDNRVYLQLFRVAGLICFTVLFVANIFPDYAMHINAINMIVLNMVIAYSALIILIKHVIFYSRYERQKSFKRLDDKNDFWTKQFGYYRDFFRFVIPLLLVGLLVWINYSTSKGNDLHEIQKAKFPTKDAIHLDKYVQNFVNLHLNKVNDSSATVPVYFVGSYGGGLKANLWNLVLLEELNEITEGKFFEHTLCLSGVSGGTVGISNYNMLMNFDNPEDRKTRIDNIGLSNILSSDLALLMGGDLLKEYIPTDKPTFNGKDRSYFGMRTHAKYGGISKDSLGNKTFRDYWASIYNKQNHYPAFIVNSTSTQGKQGVALSLEYNENDTIFPGAVNMLSLSNQENHLSYYGVVSTTNRFPLLSPAAKIKGLGHFVDGGYFENSGLLSAKGFFDYLIENRKIRKQNDSINSTGVEYYMVYEGKEIRIKPIFINIVNSKEYYTLETLKSLDMREVDGNDVSEILSILETVGSTEKTPRYITSKIEEEGLEFRRIMMPHKITLEGIQGVLKGNPQNPILLLNKVADLNESLVEILKNAKEETDPYYAYDMDKWGFIEPPLARVLSKPASQYQKVMVKRHDSVLKQIYQIDKEVRRND